MGMAEALKAAVFEKAFENAPENGLQVRCLQTLNEVRVGSEVSVCLLRGFGCERLRDLGFCERGQVRKLSGGRNLICLVGGTRLAISRELASQVIVTPFTPFTPYQACIP